MTSDDSLFDLHGHVFYTRVYCLYAVMTYEICNILVISVEFWPTEVAILVRIIF